MLKVKLVLLSLINIIFTAQISAQTTQEQWKGELVVDVGGTETFLKFDIEIIKIKGEEKCYGENTLWIDVNNISYFARSAFEGTYNEEGVLDFFDTALIESTAPQSPYFYWCVKKGKLYADDNKMTGEILSQSPKGNCAPAWARLEKVE